MRRETVLIPILPGLDRLAMPTLTADFTGRVMAAIVPSPVATMPPSSERATLIAPHDN